MALIALARPCIAQLPTSCAPADVLSLQTDQLDRFRVGQLSGTRPLASLTFVQDGLCAPGAAAQPGVRLAPAFVTAVDRTGYAGGGNDGLMWQGRGLSTLVGGGVTGGWEHFAFAIAPEFAFAQNNAFDIRTQPSRAYSPWADPFYAGGLDHPQRMGGARWTRVSAGQSYALATAGPIAAGFSNQNIWIGPGVRSSLLMSNTAPGFVHGTIGTARPLNIGIGALSAHIIGGRLSESEFHDTIPANNHGSLSMLHLEFEPKPLPGLYLGFTRVFTRDLDTTSFSFGDIVKPLFQSFWKVNLATDDNPLGNNPDNQLVSFSARWVFPASNVEFYGEWGREDHSATLDDFLQEPDHSQAFIAGFQKVIPRKESSLAFGAELTSLQRFTPPRGERGVPVWYIHKPLGYTHAGELLGSWIGPGSDSQFFHFDWYKPQARSSIMLERVRRNEAALYRLPLGSYMYAHDVELTAGLRHARTLNSSLTLDGSVEYSSRKNREFLQDDNNLALRVQLRYAPNMKLAF